jgi:hypothetical protein
MTEHRLPHTAASIAQTVDTWYATTTDGDTALIALPDTPAIWLVHRPHEHVYWRTEGRSGLTLSLADTRQRLTMVQDHVGRPETAR